MTSQPPGAPNDRPPPDDDDTYRLLPPEPKPAAGDETTPFADESWAAPEDARPKRRKRRREAAPPEPAAGGACPMCGERVAASVSQCPHCGETLAADVEEPEWKPDTGWKEPPLVSAAWYPIQGGGWKVLVVYSLLLWAATILPLVGAFIGLIVMVCHSVLLLETANYTLEGIPGGPQFPDLLSWDTISAGLMGLVIFMIAGLPLLAGVVVAVRLGVFPPALQIGLVSAALFYLPMAFLALAEEQNERALNPLLVFRGIKQLAVAYVVLCGLAAAVFLIPQYIVMLFGTPLAWQLLAFSICWLYVSVALMRAVALAGRKRGLTFE
jgi:hypothetical protein